MNSYLQAAIWLCFFTAVFLAYFYFLRFRNKERMSLIEKGIDLSEVYKKRRFPWYILGFALLGVGIGLTLGFIAFQSSDDEVIGIAMLSMAILLGASGIIFGNFVEKRNK